MCLTLINNFMSLITNIKLPPQNDAPPDNAKCCNKPPERPCYETNNNKKHIEYESINIAITLDRPSRSA